MPDARSIRVRRVDRLRQPVVWPIKNGKCGLGNLRDGGGGGRISIFWTVFEVGGNQPGTETGLVGAKQPLCATTTWQGRVPTRRDAALPLPKEDQKSTGPVDLKQRRQTGRLRYTLALLAPPPLKSSPRMLFSDESFVTVNKLRCPRRP
jgi:hypothetical protein